VEKVDAILTPTNCGLIFIPELLQHTQIQAACFSLAAAAVAPATWTINLSALLLLAAWNTSQIINSIKPLRKAMKVYEVFTKHKYFAAKNQVSVLP
jgi:hypothetical protein